MLLLWYMSIGLLLVAEMSMGLPHHPLIEVHRSKESHLLTSAQLQNQAEAVQDWKNQWRIPPAMEKHIGNIWGKWWLYYKCSLTFLDYPIFRQSHTMVVWTCWAGSPTTRSLTGWEWKYRTGTVKTNRFNLTLLRLDATRKSVWNAWRLSEIFLATSGIVCKIFPNNS